MIPKLHSRQGIKRLSEKLRKQKKRIVFTNGCFDILHAGHVMYLEKAKKAGDVLVLGLNSDASVRRIKGPARPINSQNDRARVLAGLSSIDYISIFNEETPLQLILDIKPHVLVKGSDWKPEQIAGAKEMRKWGGVLKRIKLLPGRSTTRVIRQISSSK